DPWIGEIIYINSSLLKVDIYQKWHTGTHGVVPQKRIPGIRFFSSEKIYVYESTITMLSIAFFSSGLAEMLQEQSHDQRV
ncbi:9969_t:CDS:1, partial [Acaulospora morrowiae]